MQNVDLSKYTDEEVLRVIALERPEFGNIISKLIDDGKTDDEIIRITCDAGGSPQVMRYAKKCIRAMRAMFQLKRS